MWASARARKRESANLQGVEEGGSWEAGKLGQGRGQQSRGTRDDADDDADQERCLVSLRSCSLVLAHILILVLGHCCYLYRPSRRSTRQPAYQMPCTFETKHVPRGIIVEFPNRYSIIFSPFLFGKNGNCQKMWNKSISLNLNHH